MTGHAAVAVHGLCRTYPGGVRALDGVDFRVPAGTIFGLLGPNGAGKSTLIKILTTLSRPTAGHARVAGFDVVADAEAVRRVIGCVAQRSGVDLAATGRENLTLQGRLHGLRGRALRARVADLLAAFGLSEAADRLTRTYSGGMQRKLDVAIGLIHRPRVLFLDEPTAGLDPQARTDLWTELSRLSTQDGITIMLTTHYLDEADRLAEHMAILDHGRIVVQGRPEQLKSELRGDAIHVELGADHPNGHVPEVLCQLGEVRDVVTEGRWLHARADRGAAAVPAVLAALESAGVHVASVTVARPSLDDVYLRHAGRSFDQARPGASR